MTIHVMSLKGNRYVMDLQNEAGESFTHTLIGMRIAKKVRFTLFTIFLKMFFIIFLSRNSLVVIPFHHTYFLSTCPFLLPMNIRIPLIQSIRVGGLLYFFCSPHFHLETALEIEQDFNELLGSSYVEKIMDGKM